MEGFVAVDAIQVSDVECLQLRLRARKPGGRANSKQHEAGKKSDRPRW